MDYLYIIIMKLLILSCVSGLSLFYNLLFMVGFTTLKVVQ